MSQSIRAIFVFSNVVLSSLLTYSTYSSSKIVIGDLLHEHALPFDEDLKNEGIILINKLSEEKDEEFLNDELKEIKLLSKEKDNNNFINLQNGCSKNFKVVFSSVFTTVKKDLFFLVKRGCVFSVGDKLEQSKKINVEGDSDKAYGEKKFQELKDYDKKSIPEFLTGLNAVKDKGINGWKNIQKWCKNIYGSGYLGEKSQLGIFAKKFCEK